ncbi:E2 [Macaca fascicularis papillomavirus 4]|uniref:Regulatory protein E2 n=1 Tax=Macaca fascicularis papillomavirus 4 TaxID=471182 RepID=C3PU91_RHPV1|nr:E2 [Macaca fascicularis papillomavirus 4]
MEALSDRLSALQDRILALYEDDSRDLSSQIEHWTCVRHECVLLYKARETGHLHLNNQAVPPLAVSRAKAHQAIEMQLALESLSNSDYKDEEWTLQDTSLEVWRTEPQGCFKKLGHTVTVLYDCEKDNGMDYTLWGGIYVWGDSGWEKLHGEVDYWGLYYTAHGLKVYYKEFKEDAQRYSKTGCWEVHFRGTVIQYSDSMSSTAVCETVPPAEIASGLQHSTPTHTHTSTKGTKENTWTTLSPPAKRVRRGDPGGDPVRALDGNSRPVLAGATHNNSAGHTGHSECTPVLHLKGDANCLKCLRYRFGKYTNLFLNVSSTWHWTNKADTPAIVTVTFGNEQQRQQFLSRVKIPKTVTVCKGYMTV